MNEREVLEAELARATAVLNSEIANRTSARSHCAKKIADRPTLVSSYFKALDEVAAGDDDGLDQIRQQCRQIHARIVKLNLEEKKPVDYGRKARPDRRRNGATVMSAHAERRKPNRDRRGLRASADLYRAGSNAESTAGVGYFSGPSEIENNQGVAVNSPSSDAVRNFEISNASISTSETRFSTKTLKKWVQSSRMFAPLSLRQSPAKDRTSARALLRPTIELTALVVAYLQYYFIDAYLKIEQLPTVSVFLYTHLT